MFKKNGGEKICLTQIHLVESSISLFCDIDVLLSFGKESFSKKNLSNSEAELMTYYRLALYKWKVYITMKKN